MKSIIKVCVLLLVITFFSCEKEGILSENETIETIKTVETSETDSPLLRSSKEEEEDGCETAFAFYKEAICFLDDPDLNANRWGWSIGPISSPHSMSYDIYQAAGQCNTENGDLIGSLNVSYVDGALHVDFIANDGYGFFETHLYVGYEKYPRKRNGDYTVAPGQYPYSHSFYDGTSEDYYKVDGLKGEIYIIAHAVVCPFVKKDEKPE